jgi:tetratricopeptide (TPR) repeat protein
MLRLPVSLGMAWALAFLVPGKVWGQQAGPPVIQLTTRPTADPPARALQHSLLPDALDLTPGNAALLWLRAGQSARQTAREIAQKDPKATEKEYDWASKTPLKDLPRAEVRAALDQYKTALRLADRAARCQRCDWERPPLTVQYVQEDLPLDEIQSLRQIAHLLALRCRLETAECQFDKALYTLQTGFVLARDIGDGSILIQDLVGIAIGTIMLGRLDELIQQPGFPNLYWALMSLPRPFIDVRGSIRMELGTIYRSFPGLRGLEERRMNAGQVEALIDEVKKGIGPFEEGGLKEAFNKAALTLGAATVYPQARKYFLDRGRSEDKLKAMPPLQVVLAYYLNQYDVLRDEVLKGLQLPPWQARLGLKKAEKEIRAAPPSHPIILLQLLMPALTKVYEAHVRLERRLAGLRCAEAILLHAALHEGKLPAKLADVTDLPLPLDPVTGKGFDGFYKAEGDKAVLEIPPPPDQPPQLGQRYEFTRGR